MSGEITAMQINDMFQSILKRMDDLSLQIKAVSANRNVIDGEVMLNSSVVCQMLSITKRSLLRFRNRKLLNGVRVGRQVLFRRSEVIKLLSEARNNK